MGQLHSWERLDAALAETRQRADELLKEVEDASAEVGRGGAAVRLATHALSGEPARQRRLVERLEPYTRRLRGQIRQVRRRQQAVQTLGAIARPPGRLLLFTQELAGRLRLRVEGLLRRGPGRKRPRRD